MPNTINQPITKEINLNLSSDSRSEISLFKDWKIEAPAPSNVLKKFFFNTFNGKINKTVKVKIADLKVDKALKITSNDKLVSISFQGNSGTEIEIPLNSLETFCQIVLDQSVIVDCTERETIYSERPTYHISFKVLVLDEKGMVTDEKEVLINLKFEAVELNPKVEFLLEDEFTYSSAADFVQIGNLLLSNPTPDLKYTPGIDAKITISVGNEDMKVPADAIHVGKQEGTNQIKIEGLVPHDSRCNKRRDKMVIPIYIDMRKLRNPLVPKEVLDVRAEWYYSPSYDHSNVKGGETVVEKIAFNQDAQGAELIVSLLIDNQAPRRILPGENIDLPEIAFYAESSTVEDIKLRLGNLATDRSRAGAGVKVSNLIIEETIEGAYLKDRKDKKIDEVFDKSDSRIPHLTAGCELRNGDDSHTDFILTFDPGRVMTAKETKNFHFESVLTVTFDYVENSAGKNYADLTPKKFSFTIRQPLYLLPNPKWLCIDYGSSAIVCKYDDKVLDLHARKDAIIRGALPQALQKDNLESGTPFLSSDIVLHIPGSDKNKDVSSLSSEQEKHQDAHYDRLGVFLSPTSAMINNEVLRQLPCLKLLVGNEALPSNKNYTGFTYSISNGAGDMQDVCSENLLETNPEKSLMAIDTVFRESYDALLSYFIIPEVQNINLINRLVLTYPNTYTPRHLDTLRSIVKRTIPSVRELEFVSESDAVAAYYLENWTSYHDSKENPRTDENILVYDMGAGTLDLSLINKKVDKTGKITMKIIAKIGTPKAGNYLDYVLAEIVADLIGAKTKDMSTDLASTVQASGAEVGKERAALKDFVKNVLKPQLKKENENVKLTFESVIDEKYISFTIGAVLADERLEKFLKEVTDEIVGQMANFAGSDRPKVDTVLMSGRSSLFAPLKLKLAAAVKTFNNKEGATTFIRLDEPTNGKSDVGRQKVAVTEGAMAIMERKYRAEGSQRRILSKRIYASFGVAYKDLGRWHYVELLNYKHIPNGADEEFNGERVAVQNLNNIPSLLVIQTYLDKNDTEKALNEGNWDYIAEMERVILDGQSSESLMMKINRDNNVVLYIGQKRTRGNAPKGDDLTGEAIRRSLWPVTI